IGATGEGLVLEEGDELDVRGAFLIETYAAIDTGPRFRGGVLRVGGNFDEGSPQGTQAFVGNRTLVIFDGTAPQTVIFDDPVPGASRFGDVEIWNPAGVTFVTNVVIDGQLRIVGDGALSGVQARYLSRLPITSARYSITTSTLAGAITAE